MEATGEARGSTHKSDETGWLTRSGAARASSLEHSHIPLAEGDQARSGGHDGHEQVESQSSREAHPLGPQRLAVAGATSCRSSSPSTRTCSH